MNGPLGGAISGGATLATLKLSDMTFTGDTASGAGDAAGGAVDVPFGNLDVSDSSFVGNTATAPSVPTGGAIYAGSVHISDSTFADNFAIGSAGIVDGVFAGGQGGAVYGFSVATITGSTFVGNGAVGTQEPGAVTPAS